MARKKWMKAGAVLSGLCGFVFLVFTMDCGGGGDGGAPPQQPGNAESPTLVPLGNFNVSCGQQQSGQQQQQQQQIQFQQQQQQSASCSPQFVFTESKLSDWDINLDCNVRQVTIVSKDFDRRSAVIPVQNDGSVKGNMKFQQQVQNDRVSNAVCWVQLDVDFVGKASCGPTVNEQSLDIDTQVQFVQADEAQIPRNALEASNDELAGRAQVEQQTIHIPENAAALGSRAFGVNPRRITAGTQITWINDDTSPHTVTSDSGDFDSGPIPPGGQFQHGFNDPGTYDYHDDLNPDATGEIIVEGIAPTPTATSPTQPTRTPTLGPVPPPLPLPLPVPAPAPTETFAAPTPSPSATPTATPSVTPSPTPSASPSPSPSPSPSVTPSRSPSPSPTVSPRPSPSVSPRPSPRPSPSISPRPSPSSTIIIRPIKVCVIQKPCPVVGKLQTSCPKQQPGAPQPGMANPGSVPPY